MLISFCKFRLKCIVLLTLTVSSVGAEFFSSMTALEKLLKTEEVLLMDIKQYLDYTRNHVEILENEIIKIEKEHQIAKHNVEHYLTNPIHVYRLIKRLHTDWETYKNQIESFDMRSYFLLRIGSHRETLSFPSARDEYGSALALLRLQETYELDVTAISSGFLNGIKYGFDMTWQDCFTLGVNLYDLRQFNSSKLWFMESVRRLTNEKYYPSPTSLYYIESVAESLLEFGDFELALNYSLQVLALDNTRQTAKNIVQQIQHFRNINYKQTTNEDDYSYHQYSEFKHYQKLCRQQVKMHARKERALHCRYETNNVHYRLLSPFKIEELHIDPLVLAVHDVISDAQIANIKTLALPRMQRSQVHGKTANTGYDSEVRVSQQAWLPYEEHKHLQDLLRDIQHVTGLNTTYSEQLQVLNYGVGGHYEPHFDFFTNDVQIPDELGNRIATAIFYLSDVEQGGATAFPYLDVVMKPQKGSMLFWYNLHHSTDRDYRTKHAGCPVLKGSKWIANVWVNAVTQTFIRPCLLQRDHEKSLPYIVPKR